MCWVVLPSPFGSTLLRAARRRGQVTDFNEVMRPVCFAPRPCGRVTWTQKGDPARAPGSTAPQSRPPKLSTVDTVQRYNNLFGSG